MDWYERGFGIVAGVAVVLFVLGALGTILAGLTARISRKPRGRR